MAPDIPSATYRLQFNNQFSFQDAKAILPYLASLGISHVYASPIFYAAPGSMHGYDVRDPNRLNPELGSQEDFDAYVEELHRLGMNQILDFVPNHMGVSEGENRYWADVLEHGPSSKYAVFFDIDWHPVKAELANRVLLPILGTQYGIALESGDLRLDFDGLSFHVLYYETKLPICLKTALPILQFARNRLSLGQEDPHLTEFQSILTAVKHLPNACETDTAFRLERARETEVCKQRLKKLLEASSEIRTALENAVQKWQVTRGDSNSCNALDQLLEAQSYRLSYWKVAGEEINYRRFFDINSLAAIRMELPEVFETTHRLITELLRSGKASGIRIDHVDGLADCEGYLRRLQQRYSAALGLPAEANALYLLVEKILTGHERLRSSWPVHGATGYEFANQVISVLIDPGAERMLTSTYEKFIGRRLYWEEEVYRSKMLASLVLMAGEINFLGHMLNQLTEKTRCFRDFTLNSLTSAIREVVACFPVYRSYMKPGEPVSEEDRKIIHKSISAARKLNPAIDRSIFEFLRDVVLAPTEEHRYVLDPFDRDRFITKFQQITGPLTAKGVEDTASYRYNRLLALNDVGGEPDQVGISVDHFHRANLERLQTFPHSLLATSTHDTKRSEDVRARLAVISARPLEWSRSVRRWSILNRKYKVELEGRLVPTENEEYLLYQTLIGAWPFEALHDPVPEEFRLRIRNYMLKVLREAKVNSNWIDPDEKHEAGVLAFIDSILSEEKSKRFLDTFRTTASDFAHLGAINSLSQTLLKLTVPGVPDIYQGTELWDLSLVDPDNRRPVDYAMRKNCLQSIEQADSAELMQNWRDGRIKLLLLSRMLRFRRERKQLFDQGKYEPVTVQGEYRNLVIAFRRCHEASQIVVATPRLSQDLGFPPLGDYWKDTALELNVRGNWRNIFTGQEIATKENLEMAVLFRDLPFAVLELV